tara:strand:+ start:331 stop:1326 length:996 start_codon:yes stop_codon:yes gene_type:complete
MYNNKKQPSIGQIIRRIRSNEISLKYSLFGGESFLEDYFIFELSKKFLSQNQKIIYFSMDQDSDEKLFRELSAISLFEDKRVIVVREIKKIKSKSSREDLIEYLKSPNPSTVLVIISKEYDLRNKFLGNIAKFSDFLDLRTPFQQKMKEWIKYIVKYKRIKITDEVINNYINYYGDSISHVLNEIEKDFILLDGSEINFNNINKIKMTDREYQIWNLQDSVGKKDLNKSLVINNSLVKHGVSITKILVNLIYLYQNILWRKMGLNKSLGFTGLNKIILSNISNYEKQYSTSEIENALRELQKADILSKTTSIHNNSLLQPLIIKICNNLYV